MIYRLWIVLPALLLVAADNADDERELQGTWVVVSARLDGKEIERSKVKLIIVGENFTIENQDQGIKGTFKLDLTKKPKAINVRITEAKGHEQYLGKPLQGLYSLRGDTLKWCGAVVVRKDRPAKVLLIIFKRKR